MPAQAIIVQQRRRGARQMVGMGAEGGSILTNLADAATGGLVTSTEQQLDRLELALKISIGVSIAAGVLTIVDILLRKR